jgi:hypothetical protein
LQLLGLFNLSEFCMNGEEAIEKYMSIVKEALIATTGWDN